MRIRVSLVITLLVLGLLVSCHPTAGTGGKKTVKVTILPEYSLELMAGKYMDLINYLARETGYRVEYVSSLSYSNYLSTVEASKADIGFQNALIYEILVNTRGAYPLVQAIGSNGLRTNRGIIITYRGSGIHNVSDLKGKRVMVASKKAVSGYLAQIAECAEQGIYPDRDMWIIIGTRQDQVVRKVLQRDVDAGFVREDVLPAVAKLMDVSNIRIVQHTKYFPNWVVSAFRETDLEVASKVREALLKLNEEDPEHRRILQLLGLKGFAQSADSDYEEVRKIATRLALPF